MLVHEIEICATKKIKYTPCREGCPYCNSWKDKPVEVDIEDLNEDNFYPADALEFYRKQEVSEG